MAYLQIYRNSGNSTYNHSVLKGDDLYEVNIASGEKMRWKYVRKIDKNKYVINGELIHNPPMKTIFILQRMLKPITRIAESLREYLDEHAQESSNFSNFL